MKQSIAILFVLFVLTSCGSKEKKDSSEENSLNSKTLAVTNYPLYFFTQKIAGDEFNVLFPVPQDEDPAFFEPTAEIVSIYQSAEIIFINGAGYESWVDKVALSQRKIVNTTSNVSEKHITEKGMSHSHGPEGEHDHAETAFTTWLDQSIALDQAKLIYETLKKSYPENSQEFDNNFKELESGIIKLDDQMDNLFKPYRGKTLYASHPVYQYLGDRYGIIIKSEHWEPGQKVEQDMVKSFIESLGENDAKIMLWEGEPHPETRLLLEEAGVKAVLFIPCGNRPGQGDYLSVMNQNIENLASVDKSIP
jgi:zinc transport system substrate-binding protein